MSWHDLRRQLALEFGATDVVTERDEAVVRIKDPTDGLGAHSGYRGGRHPGGDDAGHPLHPSRRPRWLVGVLHDVALSGEVMFSPTSICRGGLPPVHRFLPDLMDRRIGSGWMFDLELPLDEAAAGYEAMDTRQPLKGMLCPDPPPTKESQPDESHLRLH